MVGFAVEPWCLTLQIIASTFHSIAITLTVFRLMYRWNMGRFWWEDGWAAFALAVDIPCLISVWIDPPNTGAGPALPIERVAKWIAQLTFTTVGWACRLSILFSVVRMVSPSQQLQRIAFFVGCLFIAMWTGLIIQKILICLSTCNVGASVGVVQLTTNTIADVILVALPLWFFRRTKITAGQRHMLYPVFLATFLISILATLRASLLFTTESSGTIIIGHVKAAVSLIVCNLLVIVTFIYRRRHRGKDGLAATEELITFTNVDLNTGFTESTMTDKETITTVDEPEASSSVESCSTEQREDRRFSSCSV